MDLIQKAKNLGCIIKNDEYYLWEIQKWLREKKFYHVYVIPVNGNKWVYEIRYISLVMDDFISYLLIEQKEYSTYEEALEAGLIDALQN